MDLTTGTTNKINKNLKFKIENNRTTAILVQLIL